MKAANAGYFWRMEPIPETRQAIDEFGPFTQNDDLLEQLKAMGDRLQALVPDCVGVSLGYHEHGVTFTLVASDEFVAALDGLQYLDGGPCVSAVENERLEQFVTEDVLGEQDWQVFARGTAAAGVASTLTLPIVADGDVVGSVNLYAATSDAFDGKHDEVAKIFGAWALGAVANADLTFQTRHTAQQAPQLLLDEMRIQVAVGILVASQGSSLADARESLRQAALNAGISETAMAKMVIEQATLPPTDES
jgi:GAF domain-containing protein